MLNLKNNENDAVFDEIFKKIAKVKIKFQKIMGTFLDSIPWLKSHQPPWVCLFAPRGEPQLELGVHGFGIILEFIR